MSWVFVGATIATTVIGGISQRKQAEAQIRAGEQAQIASTNTTEQAQLEDIRETNRQRLEEKRRARREASTAVAQQANTGIAGISSKRQVDNILFQSILNQDVITQSGENRLFNIANQGFANDSAIASDINRAKSSKPSLGSIALEAGARGLSTFTIAGGGKKNGSK